MLENADIIDSGQQPYLLTVPEAAEILRIGRNNTYDLVRCGRLRCIRIGKQIRIPRQALTEFCNS